MLEIVKRKLFVHKDIWFPDEESYPPKKCDVCCLIGSPVLHRDNIGYVKYNSLMSDLDCEREQIDSLFSKVTKYDIRRSKGDELSIFHYTSEYLKISGGKVYDQFVLMYNEMYEMKGLKSRADTSSMKNKAENNGLLISCAMTEDTPMVYHVYVVDGEHARLWMSTSIFRESDDKQFRAKVGRANKRLHYEDMLYFHDCGYKTYDWGGVSSFENPNGIDQFKMSFGGTTISYYDETIICSIRYRMFYKLVKNRHKRIQK